MSELVWLMWVDENGRRGGFSFSESLSKLMETDIRIGVRITPARRTGLKVAYTLVLAKWFDEAQRKAGEIL